MHSSIGIEANEREVVARARMDPTAFASIYDRYYPSIYNYIYYRVRDGEVAQELAADVFEQVLKTVGSYQPERGPFGAWLFGVARRMVVNHLRRGRLRWFSLDLLRERSSHDVLPDETIANREQERALLQALSTLKARDQDVIALKFATQMNNRQIAAVMGLSESNVGVILYRALQRLRGLLEERGGEHRE